MRAKTDSRGLLIPIFLGIAALGVVGPQQVGACRYSVRDVGFIDLGSDPYKLYCFIQNDTPQEIAEVLRDIPVAALLDSNVKPRTVNIESEPDHPAIEYLVKLGITSVPAALLVSPEGMYLPLPLPEPAKDLKEALWTSLDEVLVSPVREKILKGVVDSHSVILFVEGKNADRNAEVRSLLEEIAGAITKGLEYLPKAIGEGPKIIALPTAVREEERVLLWSLGIGEKPTGEPSVAVLYGRARKIGEVLKAKEIQKSVIHNTLMIIGQSCECGLDRRWMQGTMIPLVWDQKIQATATDSLGFDAESPMVKMEVSRIIHKGGSSSSDEGGDGLDDILLGYSEQVIDLGGEPIPSAPDEDTTGPEAGTEETDGVEPPGEEEGSFQEEVEEVLAAQSAVAASSAETQEEQEQEQEEVQEEVQEGGEEAQEGQEGKEGQEGEQGGKENDESSSRATASGGGGGGGQGTRKAATNKPSSSSPVGQSIRTKAYAFGFLAFLVIIVGLLILARGQRQSM